ncbi:MAG: hypothetical protein WAU81_10095, partial [Candidatus Aminicenantales bacterium]
MLGRRFLLRAAAFVFLLVAAAGTAAAQVYESFASERTSIISRSKLQLGPVYLIPVVQFGFEHDSNIYGINLDRGPVQDYSAGLSVPLSAHVLAGNWLIMSLGYTPSYDYYFRVESERAFNHGLSL